MIDSYSDQNNQNGVSDPDKAEPAGLPRPRFALHGSAVGAGQGPLQAAGQVGQATLFQGFLQFWCFWTWVMDKWFAENQHDKGYIPYLDMINSLSKVNICYSGLNFSQWHSETIQYVVFICWANSCSLNMFLLGTNHKISLRDRKKVTVAICMLQRLLKGLREFRMCG